jgi:hypothetical protein
MAMRSITRRWRGLAATGLGLALAALAGCQTWVPVPGLTLPSGRYLQHPPQFIPESPPFPLPRELASMTDQGALPPGVAPAAPLPPPVPPAGAMGP